MVLFLSGIALFEGSDTPWVVVAFAVLRDRAFIVHEERLFEETFRREIPPRQERRPTMALRPTTSRRRRWLPGDPRSTEIDVFQPAARRPTAAAWGMFAAVRSAITLRAVRSRMY